MNLQGQIGGKQLSQFYRSLPTNIYLVWVSNSMVGDWMQEPEDGIYQEAGENQAAILGLP